MNGTIARLLNVASWLVASLFLTSACALRAVSAPAEHGQDAGTLVVKAHEARRLGKFSLDLGYLPDRPADEGFAVVRREFSFVIATRTSAPPLVVADRDFIFTWHVMRLERTLSERSAQSRCPLGLPKGVHLDKGEVAVPVLGGTVKVEGVLVTTTSRAPQPAFENGGRYLLIGSSCPDRAMDLPYGDSSVIPVGRDGVLGPIIAPYPYPFVTDIVRSNNVDALERLLREQ
jgi:hypothetical protein